MTKLMIIMKTDAYMSLIIITTTMENLLMHTIKKTKEPRTKETRRKPVDALPKEAARVFRTFVRVDAFPSFLVRTVVMMMKVNIIITTMTHSMTRRRPRMIPATLRTARVGRRSMMVMATCTTTTTSLASSSGKNQLRTRARCCTR